MRKCIYMNISQNCMLIQDINNVILPGLLKSMYILYLYILPHAHFLPDEPSAQFTGPSLLLDSYSSNTHLMSSRLYLFVD